MSRYNEFEDKCRKLGLVRDTSRYPYKDFQVPGKELYFIFYESNSEMQLVGYLHTKSFNLPIDFEQFLKSNHDDLDDLVNLQSQTAANIESLQQSIQTEAIVFQDMVIRMYSLEDSD